MSFTSDSIFLTIRLLNAFCMVARCIGGHYPLFLPPTFSCVSIRVVLDVAGLPLVVLNVRFLTAKQRWFFLLGRVVGWIEVLEVGVATGIPCPFLGRMVDCAIDCGFSYHSNLHELVFTLLFPAPLFYILCTTHTMGGLASPHFSLITWCEPAFSATFSCTCLLMLALVFMILLGQH